MRPARVGGDASRPTDIGVTVTSRPIPRVLLATTAAATAVLLSASSGAPALAASAAAKGTGTSGLQVLTVKAGGHTLSLGGLTLLSDTVAGSPLAKVTITPVVADGVAYGQQVVTPADSPLTVPAQTSPAALAGFATLSSPAFGATATNDPATHVGSSSLGNLSLLGIAVPVNGAVSLGSSVSSLQSVAQKTVTVQNLSLPSITAILNSLGLDLTALPVGTLTDLINALDLANAAVDTAMIAVDSAQTQVDAAVATANAAALALTQATAGQTAAQSALTAATAALQAKLDQVTGATLVAFPGANTIAGYTGLNAAGLLAVETLVPGTGAAFSTYTADQTALATANTAVTTAQAAVTAAQAALATVTATLDTALGVVDGLAAGLLDSTPLLSLDSLSITSKAITKSASAGGQTAEITGGSIQGLNVLGTDVLDAALGSSNVDLVDLVGGAADDVTAVIGDLTGTLSDVLSTVPGLPALDIPAPTVDLLTKATSTSISGGYGHALASVTGLKITLPAITLPTSVALPNAAALPALAGVTQAAGLLTSAPVSVQLATLSDQSAFAPAVTTVTTPGTNPGTNNPGLAATGLPAGVSVLSVLLLGGGLVLRRRRLAE